MKHFQLDIALHDDLVFSLRSATQGDHASLDRIPGTALWGWTAAWLHRCWPQHAVALAHQGRVRFSDARPLSASGASTHPLPLAWAYDKAGPGSYMAEAESEAGANRRFDGSRLLNLSHREARPELLAQAKSLREGYVSAFGEHVQARTRYRLRTALDASTGTVRTGQLFGYQSLELGQQFRCHLSVAADVPADVLQALFAALGRDVRLGRSRSGEYGRVGITVNSVPAPPSPEAGKESLLLWLQADALLRDSHGRPCLTPSAQALGLEGARFVPERSALRHRRYSAWNAHRNAHCVERQVVLAGSVLVFERPGRPFEPQELCALQQGLGEHGEQGLGEVLVDPPLLLSLRPAFPSPVQAHASAAPSLTPNVKAAPGIPDTALARFLRARGEQPAGAVDQQAWRLAEQWKGAVAQHLRDARRYGGLPQDQPLGPTASQWGDLAARLEACGTPAQVQAQVKEKVLGMVPPVAAATAQGRGGLGQNALERDGWKVSAGPGASLARRMSELLDAHLHLPEGTPPSGWRPAVRQAVHACQELRRAGLHLHARLHASLNEGHSEGTSQ